MRQAKQGVILLFVFSLLLMSEVKNADKPANGEWNFELENIWTVKEIGGKVLAKPSQLTVSDDGTIYGFESKQKVNFILSKNGKFVKFFGGRGEGPGEIKRQRGSYLINNKLVIADRDRLHYFTKDGEFIKVVRYDIFDGKPVFFLNENEFISVLNHHPDPKIKMGEITRRNLETGSKKVLTEFSLKKVTQDSRGGRTAFFEETLSPFMILGHDAERLYFGVNHTYEISITDFAGKKLNTLSLGREKKIVTKEEKINHFESLLKKMPGLKPLIEALPDELKYFVRIEKHNKLIYVYTAHWERKNIQPIDIFSPEGKYLYRSFIKLDKNLTIIYPPSQNPVIKKGHLYAIVEDEKGEIMIAKYKMKPPHI